MPGWIVETITTPTPTTVGVTGGTPTITATQHKLVEPTPTELVITGGQPLSGPVAIPTAAALTITGGTPTITQDRRLTPGAINLTITGGQPNVVKNTILTPTKASLAITGSQPTITNTAPVAYDTIGPGASRSAGGTSSFTHTAANGADIYLAVSWDRSGGSITSATYGGVNMNLIATMFPNNTSGNGGVALYHLAAAGNGTAKTATYTASGIAWYTGNTISFTSAPTPGTPITTYGTGTTASQTLTIPSGMVLQIVASGNGGGGGSDYTTFSGATNRWHNATSGTAMAINTVTTTGTSSSTSTASQNWAIISIPLY